MAITIPIKFIVRNVSIVLDPTLLNECSLPSLEIPSIIADITRGATMRLKAFKKSFPIRSKIAKGRI